MIRAYVMVIVDQGTGSMVASKLIKMDEVKDVEVVYGEYDVIAKVEYSDMKGLNDFVSNLRKISDVKRTSTMIAMQ